MDDRLQLEAPKHAFHPGSSAGPGQPTNIMKTSTTLLAMLNLALLPSCGKKPEIKTPTPAAEAAQTPAPKTEKPATTSPAMPPGAK